MLKFIWVSWKSFWGEQAIIANRIFLAVRDDAKGATSVEEVKRGHKNDKVYYFKCELASLKSVRQFVEDYKSRVNKKIDILIENAGVMVHDLVIIYVI
jgi:NAD(P)-dependent dehydrogenase (short-subunit alcohol dehydrogenase family)